MAMQVWPPNVGGTITIPISGNIVSFVCAIPEGGSGSIGTDALGVNLLSFLNGSTLGPAVILLESLKIPVKAGQKIIAGSGAEKICVEGG